MADITGRHCAHVLLPTHYGSVNLQGRQDALNIMHLRWEKETTLFAYFMNTLKTMESQAQEWRV